VRKGGKGREAEEIREKKRIAKGSSRREASVRKVMEAEESCGGKQWDAKGSIGTQWIKH
jgi:hypothetical protein